jgi:periplasmic copper chaperone A
MRTIRFFGLTLLAAGLILGGCTTAVPVQNGGTTSTIAIEVTDPWVRATAMGDMAMGEAQPAGDAAGASMGNGAAYLVVRNAGTTEDRLIRAASDVAGAVELHTVEESNGVMAMRPVEAIDVPAGEVVELRPGGFHVMLVGLNRELRPGDTVALTLEFERAGSVDVRAAVRAP